MRKCGTCPISGERIESFRSGRSRRLFRRKKTGCAARFRWNRFPRHVFGWQSLISRGRSRKLPKSYGTEFAAVIPEAAAVKPPPFCSFFGARFVSLMKYSSFSGVKHPMDGFVRFREPDGENRITTVVLEVDRDGERTAWFCADSVLQIKHPCSRSDARETRKGKLFLSVDTPAEIR